MTDRRTFLGAMLGAGVAFGAERGVRRPSPAAEAADLIRREIAAGSVTCVACGASDGKVLTLGNRRPGLGADVPVDGDSLFELASVSKTFVALMAAMLREEGKLDIDIPFVRYLPDHALAKEGTPITIRDLAAHASGFTNAWMGRAGVYGTKKWPFASDAEYARAALNARPEFARREKGAYSCQAMILLGFILERVTGEDLDALARRLVWTPLKMASTTWRCVPDDPRTVRMWTHAWQPLGMKCDENARHFSRPLGNAGVYSSLNDMMRYADDLLNRRAFPKACYELLFAPVFEKGRFRRSFGWDMAAGTNPPGWSAQTINHSGYTGQYVAIDPTNRRASVILSNLCVPDAARRGANFEFRRTLANSL